MGLNEMESSVKEHLAGITTKLMQEFKRHACRKETFRTTRRVVYDEFYPRHSKPIIDEIDRILGEHFGFTEGDLDFIINYDIKYRMGLGGND